MKIELWMLIPIYLFYQQMHRLQVIHLQVPHSHNLPKHLAANDANEPTRNPRNPNVKLIADKQEKSHKSPDRTAALDSHTNAETLFVLSNIAVIAQPYSSNSQRATDRIEGFGIRIGLECLERTHRVQST